MKYISLALVSFEHTNELPLLCVAPAWSLSKGDKVIVNGTRIGKVEEEKVETPDGCVFDLCAAGRSNLRSLDVITHKCTLLDDPLEVLDGTDEPA